MPALTVHFYLIFGEILLRPSFVMLKCTIYKWQQIWVVECIVGIYLVVRHHHCYRRIFCFFCHLIGFWFIFNSWSIIVLKVINTWYTWIDHSNHGCVFYFLKKFERFLCKFYGTILASIILCRKQQIVVHHTVSFQFNIRLRIGNSFPKRINTYIKGIWVAIVDIVKNLKPAFFWNIIPIIFQISQGSTVNLGVVDWIMV